MAKQKKATKQPTLPEEKPVSVQKTIRTAHPWFEENLDTLKATALNRRRAAARAGGKELSPEQLHALADELEEIQCQLNPLERRYDEIRDQLVAHWGHTGIEEIESPLGNTRITPSFELCLDQQKLKGLVDENVWRAISRRMAVPVYVLMRATADENFRPLVMQSMNVRKVKVSVVPPSSRTPQSGEAEEE